MVLGLSPRDRLEKSEMIVDFGLCVGFVVSKKI